MTIIYPTELVTQSRERLNELSAKQLEAFKQGQNVQYLLFERSDLVDEILTKFWQYYLSENDQVNLALIATGGYGRRELHLGSDIDIMVLLSNKASDDCKKCVSEFLTVLWDIGLEVGHSVRTLKETVSSSKGDITIATCLQESRIITGNEIAFKQMLEATGPENLWPSDQFFEAKYEEQQLRHQRYRGTAYNLEPNIKGNVGGLRDLQVVSWVLKRHFDANSFTELVEKGFLTTQEHIELNQARDFLWTIRFALHAVNGRKEDRLLFDSQIKVAELLNYQGNDNEKPVEAFMRDYYRTAMSLNRLNEMLLQMFREVIIEKDKPIVLHVIDEELQSKNNLLDICHDDAFRQNPSLILRVFLIWQSHANLRGISAKTMRGITENLDLIDDDFRSNPKNQQVFLDLFKTPQRLFNTLLRMNRIGVLGRFFPAFGRVVGHMQFDLFHAFTVDTHTLFVIKEIEALLTDIQDNVQVKLALAEIADVQCLLLSGLFHDIAKGRGGDHSELGAEEVKEFGRKFNLPAEQIDLLSWLVEQHLVLSITAQKKDIDDLAVIRDFARKVPKLEYLHYLYLLTIADVKGTNPKLWNTWKASLFARLYQSTFTYFTQESIDTSFKISTYKAEAYKLLSDKFSEEELNDVWSVIDDEYFLRHHPSEVAWHTEQVTNSEHFPVIAIREHQERLIDTQSRMQSLDIFIATEYAPILFSRVASALTVLNLDIYSAKLFRNKKLVRGSTVTAITFRVRETRTDTIFDNERIKNIEQYLLSVINNEHIPRLRSEMRKRVHLFNTPTRINFGVDPSNSYTTLEVVTSDRIGLLALISQCISEVNADINLAKIMTIGEKAEDVFYISNAEKTLLNSEQQAALHSKITALLKN